MNRVLAYDPQDLTLGVEPGVRIADLLRVLAEQKQFLPLAVPFPERATIGGIVAANSSSPLRHAYGGVRDFCLGMEFVTGEGIQAKSGGRVVKNVTGYDLHKLLIGSLGTLARHHAREFPDVSLLPAQGTFVASFSDAESAFSFCRAIAHSVLTPQIVEVADPGAAHLIFSADAHARIEPQQWSVIVPPRASRQSWIATRGNLATWPVPRTPMSLCRSVMRKRSPFWPASANSRRLVLEAAPSAAIFRIGVLPTAMAGLLGELSELAAQERVDFISLTRASGIVYAAFLPKEGDAAADGFYQQSRPGSVSRLRQIRNQRFGDAGVVSGRSETRCGRRVGRSAARFRADAAREKCFRSANGVLSPGRFAGGI